MKVSIRKFEYRDIENKVKWINDNDNNKYLHYELPLEVEKTKEWYLKIKDKQDRFDAVIEYDNTPVGIIGLLAINNGQAEYYVTLGEKLYRGKGIAKEATYLLLDYAFSELNLRNIYLYTETKNLAAQRMFEKCGFVKTEFVEKSAVNRGKLVDRYMYQIKASEYYMTVCNAIEVNETPLYQIDNATNRIFIKRDDMLPVSFGGNKARKAINFFKEIDQGEFDCVVTYGSSSSNHCRIVSNMAAARNLPCFIIGPEEVSNPTFNSKMMKIFGAKVTVAPVTEIHNTIEKKLLNLREKGRRPYFIPGGGHGNLGTQAYVDCYQEILEFERRNDIYFDYIFFASGTGTTQAGLVCGQIINQDKRKIIGISIARKNPRGRQVILESICEYLQEKKYSYDMHLIEEYTLFEDSYTGNGYGKGNKDIHQTIKEMLIRHGIPMDSTYTAKAYTGMQSYLRKNDIKNKNVLFIHTGGIPLFFDDLNKMLMKRLESDGDMDNEYINIKCRNKE